MPSVISAMSANADWDISNNTSIIKVFLNYNLFSFTYIKTLSQAWVFMQGEKKKPDSKEAPPGKSIFQNKKNNQISMREQSNL